MGVAERIRLPSPAARTMTALTWAAESVTGVLRGVAAGSDSATGGAPGEGLEPPLSAPKAPVLPLNEPGSAVVRRIRPRAGATMEHGRQHPAVPRSGPDERARAPRPADRGQPGDLRRARVRRGQHRGDRGRGQDLQARRLRALRRQGEPVRDRRRPRDDPADVDDDRVADLRPAARPARAGRDRAVRLHRRPHRRLPRPAAPAPARRPARRHVRDRHARGRRPPDRPAGRRVPATTTTRPRWPRCTPTCSSGWSP